jgi:hypothetical protein
MNFDAKPLQLIDEEQDLWMIPAQAVQRTYDECVCFTIPQALEHVGKLAPIESSASFNVARDRDKINPHACRILLDRRALPREAPGATLASG